MPKLIMLVGCPAAGKSTYVENNLQDYAVISADQIREEWYGSADVQGNRKVWDELYQRLEYLVEQQVDIVVDNTNVKRKYRTEILDRCEGYVVEYIVFLTPLGTCLQRNEARQRKVPEDVIIKMNRTLNDNLHLIVQETSKITFQGDNNNGN